MAESTNPTIAPYASTGEVKLRVTASLPEGEDAEALLQPAIKKILAAAGDYCYGIDVPDLQTAVVQSLRQKGLTVASAESCTGGLVAARLTEVPGASAVFGCGIVSYNNTVKAEVLGVDPAIIEQYTAVSAETAAAMAAAIRQNPAPRSASVSPAMPAPLPVRVSRSGWSLWQWPAKNTAMSAAFSSTATMPTPGI